MTKTLFLCRPGFEDALSHELSSKSPNGKSKSIGEGLLLHSGTIAAEPYIFEQRRIENAAPIPIGKLRPIAPETMFAVFKDTIAHGGLWRLYCSYAGEDPDVILNKRSQGIANNLLRLLKKHEARCAKRQINRAHPAALHISLCLTTESLWYGTSRNTPGILPHLKRDSRAPSRSYLKVEEAFLRMNRQPQPNETVIDLGAAPGGWSFAFIKRGCHVTAVDSGPLKLPPFEPDWGTVEHLRVDGISYEPKEQVDWLVSDMLVAPGVAQGLMRRWMQRRGMKHMVCNAKIPQQQPYAAIVDLEKQLNKQSDYTFQIRQLYHDRREVTVMASLSE